MLRKVVPALFLAALFATASIGQAEAVDYEIKLVRPPKVGQKYSLTADGAMMRHSTYTVDGESGGTVNDGFAIHLEGTVEVLVVNKDGEESKSACTVSKCTRITADGETEMIPAGRVVTAIGGLKDTTFSIDQGDLSDDAKETLELVLRLGEDDGYSDDRIYGTTSRKAVGQSWNLDADAAVAEAKADGAEFGPADIVGSMKLLAVEKFDEVDCLRISGDTTIKSFTVQPPEGMSGARASLKARYTGRYPVDAALGGPLSEQMSVTQTATFHGKDAAGKKMTVKSTVQRAAELKRNFLAE